MQVSQAQPTFGGMKFSKFRKGTMEYNAVEIAKAKLGRRSDIAARDISVSIKPFHHESYNAFMSETVCNTTVSKTNKTPIEKALHLFGFMPKGKKRSELDTSIFALDEHSLANYIIRDVRVAMRRYHKSIAASGRQ